MLCRKPTRAIYGGYFESTQKEITACFAIAADIHGSKYQAEFGYARFFEGN
jgi:hypothetical protein